MIHMSIEIGHNNVYKLYNSGLLQSTIKYEIEIEIINNSIKNIDNNVLKRQIRYLIKQILWLTMFKLSCFL